MINLISYEKKRLKVNENKNLLKKLNLGKKFIKLPIKLQIE